LLFIFTATSITELRIGLVYMWYETPMLAILDAASEDGVKNSC